MIYSTLEKLKKLFESKLQMKICLNHPYKLCDLKPMYGVLFEDYLDGYDFWGHCDSDLVFGNIRKFLNDELFSKYDRILSRGHLSLYHNTKEVNNFFKKSESFNSIPCWKDVVRVDRNYSYDEWGGVSCMWKVLNAEKMYDEIVFDDIFIQKKHFLSCQKEAKGMDKGKSHFIFEYDNGELYRWFYHDDTQEIIKEPILYAHFQKRDMQLMTDDFNRYLIIPNRFFTYQNVTNKYVLHWGKKHFFYMKYYKIRWNNLKRKIFK